LTSIIFDYSRFVVGVCKNTVVAGVSDPCSDILFIRLLFDLVDSVTYVNAQF